MDIKNELFIAEELSTKDGYTWTINSRLSDALWKAEELFGERDKNYTLLGVEFALSDQPQVWFPENRKHILIQLNKNALENVNQAIYQLTHEIVHCLSPTGQAAANVLEEGLATYFSEWYMQNVISESWHPTLPQYKYALKLVKQLLETDVYIIKKVRAIQPTISEMTPSDFLQINLDLDQDLLEKLCKPFTAIANEV